MRLNAFAIGLTTFASAAMLPMAHAQHFAPPQDVDLSDNLQIGEPVFTIAQPTTSFGAASIDGWLYVLGGYFGRPHDYHIEAQSSSFYRVNLFNPSHAEMLPNELRVQSCPIEPWNGVLVRTGGLQVLNERRDDEVLASLDGASVFDPETGAWEPLPDMPVARSSHDSAVLGSTLFVVGGWTLDTYDGERTWRPEMLSIDLSAPHAGWSATPAPFKRRALASVAVDDVLVVLGGMTSGGQISRRVDVYDPAMGEWSTGPSFPGSGFGVGAGVVDGHVVASGHDGEVYAWAPGDLGWAHIATLTFPRFFHQIVEGGDGDALFLGGISQGVRPVHVERVAMTASASPAAAIHHWVVPSPSPAKNRQGLAIRNGWLYAFGGNNSVGQHDFEPHNFVDVGHRLSLASLSWRSIEDMPANRQSLQAMSTGDVILAFGGFGHDGDVARTFDEGFAYDPSSKAWHTLGQCMPTPRSQYGLVEHDGMLWAFGGLDYDSRRTEGDQFRHLTQVVAAPADSESIMFADTGVNVPTPRRAFGGAKLGDLYYLVGGMQDGFRVVESCEVFDFDTQSFSTMPSPARPRLSPDLVALGGKLYLGGGSSPKVGGGFESNASIEMYDPATERWSTLIEEIPISPRHMRMMPFRGRLLLFSTHEADRDVAHVVVIDPRQLD